MLSTLKSLSDKVLRKFVDVVSASFLQVKGSQGWVDVETVNKTVKYEIYEISFESGRQLRCADNHILITAQGEQVFAKDSLGLYVASIDGVDKVVNVYATSQEEHMYDLSLCEESNKLYYTGGVLSHNTTIMTIFALWQAMFKSDQNIIICAHVGAGAKMIFERIKFAYEEMDNWIKTPIVEYNRSTLRLTNGSRIFTASTSINAIRGNSATCLILDEFAFVDPTIQQPFWTAIMPTMSSNPNAKLFVSSTPNGVGELFWKIATDAEKGKSNYKLMTVTWECIPGRDQKWKEDQIQNEYQGDRDKFAQEYECKFLGSSDSPLPPDVFDFVESTLSDPVETLDEGKLRIWKRPANDRVYAIGVDVSEGIGKDASVIQVFDFTDMSAIEQVACYYDKNIAPTPFSDKVMEVAAMYGFPPLAVERNGCGSEVAHRLYFDKNYLRFLNYGATQGKKNKITRAGIHSVHTIKNKAVDNLRKWLVDKHQVVVHDEAFLDELRAFTFRGDTWAAANGKHDDIMLSVIWTLFFLHDEIVERHYAVDSRDKDGTITKLSNLYQYNVEEQGNQGDPYANNPYGRYGAGVFVYGSLASYRQQMRGQDETSLEQFQGGCEWTSRSLDQFVLQKEQNLRANAWDRGVQSGFWVRPAEGRNFLL